MMKLYLRYLKWWATRMWSCLARCAEFVPPLSKESPFQSNTRSESSSNEHHMFVALGLGSLCTDSALHMECLY
ncbi:hypothetical protein CYLTODRAFT_288297 [Cylindrobasidium torrendii FP15055 ss-10]|uniref:Uncharacterized protein n=1 Tax=Cylindrobasidium torrendii FP15055 ss-10 TaxID=1314674 RepID=A0A0D7BDC7_9AGAR|nr:hypothetical protein CYLTODRAFT_288297 [Cylindrobasidium torrendii FP15055 ss-10]